MDNEEWFPEDVWPKIGDMGFFGLTVPEEYGGVGLDFFTSGLVGQAMAALEPRGVDILGSA